MNIYFQIPDIEKAGKELLIQPKAIDFLLLAMTPCLIKAWKNPQPGLVAR